MSINTTFLILIILSLLLMYIINYHNNLYESFYNLTPEPINFNNSNKLANCPNDSWRHPPPSLNKININPFTHYMPVSSSYTNLQSLGPSIDGNTNSPNNMFMFAYNQCKPECCPSTYSCDGGCICTTKAQLKFGRTRGNNKTLPINNEF